MQPESHNLHLVDVVSNINVLDHPEIKNYTNHSKYIEWKTIKVKQNSNSPNSSQL